MEYLSLGKILNNMFTLIAKITILEEHVEFVTSELKKLIEPSRAKEGCLSYTMYKDKKDDKTIFFIEKWESNDVFIRHMQSELILNYSKRTNGMVKKLELNKIEEIVD